jgi:hypothetical protein
MGIPMTTEVSAAFLREQAARFRGLAREIVDEQARQALLALAQEYEERAQHAPNSANDAAR